MALLLPGVDHLQLDLPLQPTSLGPASAWRPTREARILLSCLHAAAYVQVSTAFVSAKGLSYVKHVPSCSHGAMRRQLLLATQTTFWETQHICVPDGTCSMTLFFKLSAAAHPCSAIDLSCRVHVLAKLQQQLSTQCYGTTKTENGCPHGLAGNIGCLVHP